MATEALKILAIDDTPDNLITLRAVVRDALPGTAVVTALSGPQGIALARAEDPDVILLDIVMPGMDGYAVCRALKADDCLRHIPVVFLTALRADRESRIQTLEAGAEAFLAKPLDEVELIAQIRAMAKIKAANQMQRLEREQLAALVAERTRELELELAERKQAEEALRESEARFRVIFEHANDAIHVSNADDEILQVNPRMRELMGYSREELLTMRVSDLQAPEVRGQPGHVLINELARHGNAAYESLNLHRSGRRIPVEVSVARIESAQGDLYVSIVRDITERKRAEEALRESEAKARRLLEQQIAINQLALALGESLDLNAVYHTIHKHIQGMMDVWCFIISSYDEQTKLIQAEYAAADRVYDVAEFPPIPLAPPGTGTQSRVIHTGQPLYTPDHQAAVRQSNVRYTIEGNGSVHEELPSEQDEEDITRSVVYLPMKIKGQPVGILQVQSRRLDAYSAEDISLLAGMANVAAVAIQNARLHEEVLRELGERKRAENALRLLSARQQALLVAIPDIVMEVDRNKVYTWGNQAGIEFFGEDVVGKEAAFYFEGEQDLYDMVQPLFDGNENVIYVESWQRRKDGEKRLLAWWCQVLKDDGGNVTGALSSARDITERKQAEAERTRLLAQVQAQAQQIAQLMDTVPEGVLLLEADGRVLLANPAGGRDLAALAGAAVGERLTHLGDRPLAELLAAAERGRPWHELRAGRRIFEAIARPVVAGSPAAGHWVLVINDVTQARDLREQLQQQERLAAVGQLAAGIAHDFNNILAIIALQALLVARAPALAARDRERLTIISEQTGHATRLIQQLLDFSRRAVLERRPLDLGPLLQEQVKLLARTLPETIAVTLACAPGEYVVLADPTRLQQMLMNLAVNARDAMPAGGTLRLTLARQATAPRPDLPAGPWVRLTVADSGTGIAPEAQAHLFEPFFTTKPRGQGTGLGLAQVHGIVKQHAGEIEVQSAIGQGVTFTIYLPGVAEAAAVPAPAATAPPASAAQLILIVEDNAVLLDAMADTVELLGYRVVGAGNGAEALAVLAARGDTIALVLSDLVMPVMGGEALFQAMRARGFTTPVVMLSGHPLEGELAGLKAQGLAGWLLKPPELDDLARLLAQALASSQS